MSYADFLAGKVRRAVPAGFEKHMCPLQLDVIERACVLWSNPGEVVFTPFAGIGSELVGALKLGRKAVGVELKPEYFRHAVENVRATVQPDEALPLFRSAK